jgi:hypothetical protein
LELRVASIRLIYSYGQEAKCSSAMEDASSEEARADEMLTDELDLVRVSNQAVRCAGLRRIRSIWAGRPKRISRMKLALAPFSLT